MDPPKPISLKIQRVRDKKESEIDISYTVSQATKDLVIRHDSQTKKLLKNYQKWKEDNSVPGIKY